MFDYIRMQFRLGKLTAQQVMELAGKFISLRQAGEITGEKK